MQMVKPGTAVHRDKFFPDEKLIDNIVADFPGEAEYAETARDKKDEEGIYAEVTPKTPPEVAFTSPEPKSGPLPEEASKNAVIADWKVQKDPEPRNFFGTPVTEPEKSTLHDDEDTWMQIIESHPELSYHQAEIIRLISGPPCRQNLDRCEYLLGRLRKLGAA